MNKKYCECSAGWYMRLFSEVFEKSVTITIVDTIVNGAAECVFEISDYIQTDKFQLLELKKSELSGIVKRYGFDTVQQFYNAIKIAQDATYKYQMDVATWEENTTKSNL